MIRWYGQWYGDTVIRWYSDTVMACERKSVTHGTLVSHIWKPSTAPLHITYETNDYKTSHLRNRKYFPCFPTVIETRVEVWENEKLKWEREPVERVFPRNFEVPQTSTSVFITYGNTGKNVFNFFYKITRRKLKRGNSLLYQSVNSPYRSRWRMRWRMWWREPFHVFHTVIETRLLANQSSLFQNVIL